MKALTLQQPYATLGAVGLKPWETRSKPTTFRGRHLITSSMSPQPKYMALTREWVYVHQIDANPCLEIGKLVFGGVVGSVEITDCVTTLTALEIMKKEVTEGKITQAQMDMYVAFGDFSPGRWAYRWERPVMLETPVQVKGSLGLWDTKNNKACYTTPPYERANVPGSYFKLCYLGEATGFYAATVEILHQYRDTLIAADSDKQLAEIERRVFKL